MAGKVDGSWRQAKSSAPVVFQLLRYEALESDSCFDSSVCCASPPRLDGNPLVMASVSSRHSGKAVAESAGCYISIRDELLWVVVPAKKTLLLLCAGSKRDWTPIDDAKPKEAQNL